MGFTIYARLFSDLYPMDYKDRLDSTEKRIKGGRIGKTISLFYFLSFLVGHLLVFVEKRSRLVRMADQICGLKGFHVGFA